MAAVPPLLPRHQHLRESWLRSAKELETPCCDVAQPGFSKMFMARQQRWHSSREKQLSVVGSQ